MNKHEWNNIVKDAFSPEKPEPHFSERYRRQRRELERMVTMKKETKRFNAGFWAIAVACCLVAVSPIAIHTMTQSKLTAPEQPSQINPASLADGENLAIVDPNENIPIYTIGFNLVPSYMNSSVITTLHTDASTNETYYIARDELTSTNNEHKYVSMLFMRSDELTTGYKMSIIEQGTLDNGYSVVFCYDNDGNSEFIDGSPCYVYVDFNNGWGTEIAIQGLTEDEIKTLISSFYFREDVTTTDDIEHLQSPNYRMGFNSVPEGMGMETKTTVYYYDSQAYYAEIPYLMKHDDKFVSVQFIRSDDIEQLTENHDFSIFSLYDESTLPNGIQAFTYATTDENGELVDNFVTYTYLVFGDTGWGAEVFGNCIGYEEYMNLIESVYFIPAVSQHEENVPAEIEDDFVERTDVRYKLVFDWLPDRMFYQHDGPYAEKIHSSDNSDPRNITPMLLWMADGTDVEFYADASSQFPVSDAHTLENGNRGVITCDPDFQDGDDCVAFVQLNDRYYVQLFCRGLTAEEVIQVMEGASIVEADEQYTNDDNASIQTPQTAEYDILENEEPLADEIEAEIEIEDNGSYSIGAWEKAVNVHDKYKKIENLRLCEIGETVDYYEQTIDAIDNFAPMTVCVDSVRVQSNFDGITTDGIGRPADFSEYLDENGEIWTMRTIGVDGTPEKVRQYVVITELTFTNTGDTAVKDVNYNNFIYPEKDGTLLYFYQTYENGLCSDGGNHFSISADSELDKNNIKRIEAGQSVHVTCANVVDEDKFGHIYLELNEIASSQKELLERPIIDLTDLKPEN